jgi:uncharacterized membrane protein
MSEGPVEERSGGEGSSSTGLDSNLAGLLCYLAMVITGVVFLILEKEDRYVRFHAYQSVATFAALWVLSAVVRVVPGLGVLLGGLVWAATLIVWVVLMVKAFQGERWKLPYVGDWAEEQARH